MPTHPQKNALVGGTSLEPCKAKRGKRFRIKTGKCMGEELKPTYAEHLGRGRLRIMLGNLGTVSYFSGSPQNWV